jgi:hypothetical protein
VDRAADTHEDAPGETAGRVSPGALQGILSIDRDALRAPSGSPSGPSSQATANQSTEIPAITRSATALLDESIGRIGNVLALVRQNIELTGRADVLRQMFPDVDEALPFAGIDRDAVPAWTDSGPRTVGLLLERLQVVRRLLGSDKIFYRTPEGESVVSHCSNIGKPADLCTQANEPYAWACRNTFSVLLCPAFVQADTAEQILTLIHEAAHLAYPDLTHSAGVQLDNAFCIERIVGILTKTYSVEAVAGCQAPDVLRRD